jgi:diguanylate cyclase (GGDEF)-like protein/PAS domain S-box-containing protein
MTPHHRAIPYLTEKSVFVLRPGKRCVPGRLQHLWISADNLCVTNRSAPTALLFHDFEVCRGILESLPTGLCVIDVEKKIVFWSEGAERITGHLRHELIGRSCISEPLFYCDQPDCEFCSDDCPLARAIKTARPTETIGFLHHKAGHEIPIHARSLPVRNEQGSVIGAVAIFEDEHEPAVSDPSEDTPRQGCVDENTGVANHVMMQSHLREALATFAEMRVPFGVLRLRIERLEHFRASFGPEAASSLLRVVARTLESALWRTDCIGRWADDEFLIILNGCRDDALYPVRERMRRMLANDAIEWWGERRSLPLSIGQATAQAGDTADSLLERTQQSLEAAAAGRSLAAATLSNPFSRS